MYQLLPMFEIHQCQFFNYIPIYLDPLVHFASVSVSVRNPVTETDKDDSQHLVGDLNT